MPLLQIVVVSTRPGRVGAPIAHWFHDHARRHGKFDTELVDLGEVNLPLFDEPRHPRLQQYEHEHTKQWSARVSRADAFVFVTPEYNYSSPPSLINALDFLLKEWAYKPAAFVSYGGVSGGLRSVQMTKQIITGLRMMPIPDAVVIPFFTTLIDAATGAFTPNENHTAAADVMLNELFRWAGALRSLRA